MNDPGFTQSGPIILALDTSSKETSLAISRGNEALHSFAAQSDEKRSEKLWIDIRALLDEAGIAIDDVELFGVCVGPGGFTGLRVGIAAAKGLAAATGKPLAGITSLEASAFLASRAAPVCAMIKAYKGEVYSQLFELDERGGPVALSAPVVSTSIQAIERVADLESVTFVGDGAIDNAEAIRELAGDRFRGAEATERSSVGWRIKVASEPVAERVAGLAYLKMIRGETDTAESLQACYVRPAEAEIKLSQGLLGSKVRRSMKAE